MSTNPKLEVAFSASLEEFEKGVKQVSALVDQLDKKLSGSSSSFSRFGKGANMSKVELNQLNQALAKHQQALQANQAAIDRNTEALKRHKREAVSSGSQINAFGSSLKSMALGYLSVDAAMQGGRAFVNNAIEVNKFEKVLKTATGSQKDYTQSMKFLDSIAKSYRLNILELGKSYSQLTIATKGTAIEGDATNRLFKATAVAASALQMSTDDVNGTFRAFIQMVSKGNVQAEELRGQLGERLVGAFNMAAKSMGVSTMQLNKMLEQGQVLAADLLPKLAVEIEKTFGEDAKEGAQSLGNQINYASGQVSLMFAEFAKTTGAVDGLANVASGVGDVAERAREAMDGPLGRMLAALAAVGKFGFNLQTGFAFSDPSQGKDIHAGYTQSLNPFNAYGSPSEKKAFNDSNAWYSRVGGIRTDILNHQQGIANTKKAQIEAEAKERLRLSHEAYAKLAPKSAAELAKLQEKLRAEAEKGAAQELTDERIEFQYKLKQVEMEAVQRQIDEWNDKKSRPTFGAMGMAKSENASKMGVYSSIADTAGDVLPTGFGGIEKFVEQINGHDIDATIKIRLTNNLAEEINDQQIQISNQIEQFSKELKGILEGFAVDSIVAFGETIGNLASGLSGEEASKRIGEVFGGLLNTLGKAMVAFGVAKLAADEALLSMNAYVALAAGVVAIAAGTALKNASQNSGKQAAQNFWTGGVVDGPGGIDKVPAWLSKGEMILNGTQQSRLFRILNGEVGTGGAMRNDSNKMDVNVNIAGILSGHDITLATERTVRNRRYFTGGR